MIDGVYLNSVSEGGDELFLEGHYLWCLANGYPEHAIREGHQHVIIPYHGTGQNSLADTSLAMNAYR